jgi:cytochrome c5
LRRTPGDDALSFTLIATKIERCVVLALLEDAMRGVIRWACLGLMLVIAAPGLANPRGYTADTRAYNLAHGRVVFQQNCLRCHESGRRGAPIVEHAEDWQERLQQPLSTLIRHAIDGHGDMPPRGDQVLTDQDVAAAVDRTRLLLDDEIVRINNLPPTAAGPSDEDLALRAGSSDDAVMHMFLMLFGKERWK